MGRGRPDDQSEPFAPPALIPAPPANHPEVRWTPTAPSPLKPRSLWVKSGVPWMPAASYPPPLPDTALYWLEAGALEADRVGTGVWSKSRRTDARMCPADKPASSYCSVWVPASMNESGSTIGRIFRLP